MKYPWICRLMAWMINAALLVWVAEGMLILVAVGMVRTGRLAPDRLADLAGRDLVPLILAQAVAIVLLGAGSWIRHRLGAGSMSPSSYAWLVALLLCVLVFATAALLLSVLPTFRTLTHIDIGTPDRHMTRHSVEGKQYWFSEEMPKEQLILQGLREINDETGILFSLGICSALGLLILNARGAWEKRQALGSRGGGRRNRVPPWRLPPRPLY